MLAAIPPNISELRLGPLEWRPTAKDVLAFKDATRTPNVLDGSTPLVFPIRILAIADWRATLSAWIGADRVAIHEAQNFTFLSPLCEGTVYCAIANGRMASEPMRLILDWMILEGDERKVEAQTVLRLFDLNAVDAGP